jgi:hypothetical protein
VNLSKIISRRIRHKGAGVDLVGDVNAAIAANVGKPGSSTHVSSSQRVVQGSGRTRRETRSTEPDQST